MNALAEILARGYLRLLMARTQAQPGRLEADLGLDSALESQTSLASIGGAK